MEEEVHICFDYDEDDRDVDVLIRRFDTVKQLIDRVEELVEEQE